MESFELITRNLQEVVDEDKLKTILQNRSLKVYWGTAPTGRPHIGYFVPMFKIRDLLNAGCEVTILLADVHAFLDNLKSSVQQLEARTEYYRFIITEMLKSVGADVSALKFVTGRDFQLDAKYTFDMYKIASLASTRDATRAGAEVVKQVENPKLSGLLYPILQALDEQYLEVDAQFGGVDQRKIFMFAREYLPQLGYEKRIHLMNPMIGGLGEGGKMSASDANSKVDILDTPKQVQKKLNKGHCIAGDSDNFFIDFARIVMFPHLGDQGKDFIIDRPEKFGGPITYKTYDDLVAAFQKEELHPLDLKMGLAAYINSLLAPIQEAAKAQEIEKLVASAYEN
jgi:tyrosyl-tRNA synthetase